MFLLVVFSNNYVFIHQLTLSSYSLRSELADLSGVERYFCFWNFFSRPMSCSSVKMVRLRRGFFKRAALLCSVSDSLLMLTGVSLGEGSAGWGWWGESRGRWATCPGGEGVDKWGMLGGCRVMTDKSGYARREEGPEEEERKRERARYLRWENFDHRFDSKTRDWKTTSTSTSPPAKKILICFVREHFNCVRDGATENRN